MKEELITFETAKLAKKKGFDIKTKNWYDQTETLNPCNGIRAAMVYINEGYAPNQSLLQKWLREKYNTDITVITDWINGARVYYVGFSFINQENEIDIWFSKINSDKIKYSKYEQALEIGLQEALKLIES